MEEDLESIILNGQESIEPEHFELTFHPALLEKLIVEISANHGDVFFIPEQMLSAAMDPKGLYPLDDVTEENKFKEYPQDYKEMDPETGTVRVFAFPISEESSLFEPYKNEIKEPLVAIVPNYSDHKEISIELLQYFSK
ncbi:ABC-type glycerol-3-phosphate transport system substrate-binding protein [Salibacterium salarium]|nr:ABC-type glycerol-3-phosphate transport system substrate-binding protein [Salibacterium salarium]